MNVSAFLVCRSPRLGEVGTAAGRRTAPAFDGVERERAEATPARPLHRQKAPLNRSLLGRVIALALTTLFAVGCGDVSSQAATVAAAPAPGQAIYEKYCYGCHAFGAAGAPLVGDRAVWAPRLARGEDALVAAAMAGVPPGMPPKGGMCIQCSEEDVRAAVVYMLDAVR